jgi:hypothetical protein
MRPNREGRAMGPGDASEVLARIVLAGRVSGARAAGWGPSPICGPAEGLGLIM